MRPRSLLIVAAGEPLPFASGADALIVDLVGASPEAKARARDAAAAVVALPSRPKLFARVAGFAADIDADLEAILPAAPDGVLLSNCEGGDEAQRLGARLAVWEARLGLSDGATRILAAPAPEAATVFAFPSYVGASARLAGLIWSPREWEASFGPEASPFKTARDLTILAALAAGVTPIEAIFTADETAFRAQCLAARRDGVRAVLTRDAGRVGMIHEVLRD